MRHVTAEVYEEMLPKANSWGQDQNENFSSSTGYKKPEREFPPVAMRISVYSH
jgi:hypothetical protein